MNPRESLLRSLPKIDELLRRPELSEVPAPRWAVVEALRRQVEELRRAILDGSSGEVAVDLAAVRRLSEELCRPSLRKVVNATGVVLHTNLGRAPLAAGAVAAVAAVARGYSNLEYDLAAGGRGSRHGHLAAAIRELTGAEDAVCVNNNAAAVLLGLSALAAGREVVVSRGELVEIGGSFRIPDVMRQSGARLREVGTTNKTRLGDYEAALGDDTALLLKVHRSNFEIVGFTEEAALEELVELGRRCGVGVMVDLGSGALVEDRDFHDFGLPAEPGVRAAVASGADLVTFSGAKLLGGPQAGILAGTVAAVAACRAHPLMRAVRPDKMTIAALLATLALYRDGRARDEVPALAMLGAPLEALRARAEGLCRRLSPPEGVRAELEAMSSAVGGGALPTAELPSWGVSLSGRSADELDRRLRAAPVPVIGRIRDDRLLLDVRALAGEDDLEAVVAAVGAL